MRFLISVVIARRSFNNSLIDRESIDILDADLGDVSRVLSHWGVGFHDLLAKDASSAGTADDSSR